MLFHHIERNLYLTSAVERQVRNLKLASGHHRNSPLVLFCVILF